jgi:hypothetical protein
MNTDTSLNDRRSESRDPRDPCDEIPLRPPIPPPPRPLLPPRPLPRQLANAIELSLQHALLP